MYVLGILSILIGAIMRYTEVDELERKFCNHIWRESEYKDKESGNYSVDTGVVKCSSRAVNCPNLCLKKTSLAFLCRRVV